MMKAHILTLALTLLPLLNQPSAAEATSPKQGAKLLKTDILGVFAHPDDETGLAATLAYYARAKDSVIATVYCTRGEGGGNMVGTHWGSSLGILREAELRDCLSLIGVRYCYFLDQLDWAYTESAAMTLEKWDRDAALGRLVRLIRALRPEVIVTMNPVPHPGRHGHHQAAGILATEAATAAADSRRFSDQIQSEGLTPWQVRKLYYSGAELGPVATITVDKTLSDGTTPAEIAGNALANHRSQGFGNFSRSPRLRRPQQFSLIRSAVPFAKEESDLLRGLPTTRDNVSFRGTREKAHELTPISFRFRPRPAIVKFRAWAESHEVGHLADDLTSDIPVIKGEPNTLYLDVENNTGVTMTGRIQIAAPTGWITAFEGIECKLPANGKLSLPVEIIPPENGSEDIEIAATAAFNGELQQTATLLHPLPRTFVPRLHEAPSMTGLNRQWRELPAHRVTLSNLVQGKVANFADSQAEFRLAHDEKDLYVAIDIADEKVVSNIAPDDIRGHWRSDSVELCIDPSPGSEHTLGCFKLGIFPFDTTGVVRAARDADANQGPIELTSPGTRIFSERTPGGYRILTAIPFAEIGFDPEKNRRLGFNLIVYDGDKEDAAIGENINESRIAWAPQSGVQGRPEDWGRIDLK